MSEKKKEGVHEEALRRREAQRGLGYFEIVIPQFKIV
jgi:hypothetical protein